MGIGPGRLVCEDRAAVEEDGMRRDDGSGVSVEKKS